MRHAPYRMRCLEGHSRAFLAIIVAPESMDKYASATKLQTEATSLGSGSSERLAHS